MKLTILDRLKLVNLLPTEGNAVKLIHVKGITELLTVSSKEATEAELEYLNNGMIKFNPEKSKEKNFDLSKDQIAIFKEVFTELDKTKKLNIDQLDLFQMFEKL